MRALSNRESQVLALMRQGKTNQEIAVALGLSLSTVRGHCTTIMLKLDAPNRAAAVAKSMEEVKP
jgi:DNA-binding CsgD family transcriptional regulator